MAMVQPKSQKLRLFTTHLLLLIFIAAIMFPLLMVIAISLREGNFAGFPRLALWRSPPPAPTLLPVCASRGKRPC